MDLVIDLDRAEDAVDVADYFATLASIGGGVVASDLSGGAVETRRAMASFLHIVERARRARTRVMFIGNGGSAAICSHMATDWTKNGGFSGMSFNDGAMLTCLSNDLGYDQVFAHQIRSQARSGDVLVAISSSGNSMSIVNGVVAAREAGAAVVTLSGFSSTNKLRTIGDLNFYLADQNYGYVEIAHLAICHCILDTSMRRRTSGATKAGA